MEISQNCNLAFLVKCRRRGQRGGADRPVFTLCRFSATFCQGCARAFYQGYQIYNISALYVYQVRLKQLFFESVLIVWLHFEGHIEEDSKKMKTVQGHGQVIEFVFNKVLWNYTKFATQILNILNTTPLLWIMCFWFRRAALIVKRLMPGFTRRK